LGNLTNKGVDSKGVIPSEKVCAVSGCTKRNWCEVTAVCRIIHKAELYRNVNCPTKKVKSSKVILAQS
jgi:hypothetical protein